MTELVTIVAIFCLLVGAGVFALNPYRLTNQVFSLIAVLVAFWLASVASVVIRATASVAPDPVLAFLLRTNALVAAYFPWAVWMLKESLVAPTMTLLWRRSLRWFFLCSSLSLLTFIDSFVFYSGQPAVTERGAAYIIYSIIGASMYLTIIGGALKQMRGQIGIRRMEIQYFVLNLGIACLSIVLLTAYGNIFQIQILKKLSIIVFLVSFLINAWSTYAYKIYDASHVFIALGQRIFIAFVCGAEMALMYYFLFQRAGIWITLFAGVLLLSCTVFWWDAKTRDWLDFDGRKKTDAARTAIVECSQTEPNTKSLRANYAGVIARLFLADFARIGGGNEDAGESTVLGMSELAATALFDLGWATPESIERRKQTEALGELRRFMLERHIGVLVTGTPFRVGASIVLAVGAKADRWPYTYPEVHRLKSLAELMDNILAHSRLMEQAALKERLDKVELLTRGLAHDLKNLLTPVSTFLMHTEHSLRAGTLEYETYGAAKQSAKTMLEYLGDVNALSIPLKPKLGKVNLKDIAARVIHINSVVAARRMVTVQCDMHDDIEIEADEVLVNRLLANVLRNSMDAVEDGGIIVLACVSQGLEGVRISVEDNGCGIPSDIQDKVCTPYFTTKKGGRSGPGMGIGLTICERIVQLHGGVMNIESKVSVGTRVSISLPNSSIGPASLRIA